MKYRTGGIADAGPAIIIGLLIGLVAAQIMPSQTHTQPASAAVSEKYDGDCTGTETAGRCADKPLVFDHSNCQYPDRWSNPTDGCDNSDPAVPECIKAFSTKAGEDACIAAFVAQNNSNPVTTTPTVTTTPAKANECGGK